MVDESKIAFNPAVELSYLESSEQRILLDAMELNDCTPSHAQTIKLKKLSQEGVLNDQTIYEILAEQKPNQQEQYKFKREDIRKYFPKSYTDKQVCGNCYNYEYDSFVFVDELGERMRPDYPTSQFPAFIQRHGMRKMRFHDLRHPNVKPKTKIS